MLEGLASGGIFFEFLVETSTIRLTESLGDRSKGTNYNMNLARSFIV